MSARNIAPASTPSTMRSARPPRRRRRPISKALADKGSAPITTEIATRRRFYFAEDYHQQYLAKNPAGYCGLGGTGVSCPIGVGVSTQPLHDPLITVVPRRRMCRGYRLLTIKGANRTMSLCRNGPMRFARASRFSITALLAHWRCRPACGRLARRDRAAADLDTVTYPRPALVSPLPPPAASLRAPVRLCRRCRSSDGKSPMAPRYDTPITRCRRQIARRGLRPGRSHQFLCGRCLRPDHHAADRRGAGARPDAGRTGRAIAAQLRNGFIREPYVAAEVEAYRPFFILGEVAAPGQYPYVPNMTRREPRSRLPAAFRRAPRAAACIVHALHAGRSAPPSVPLRRRSRPAIEHRARRPGRAGGALRVTSDDASSLLQMLGEECRGPLPCGRGAPCCSCRARRSEAVARALIGEDLDLRPLRFHGLDIAHRDARVVLAEMQLHRHFRLEVGVLGDGAAVISDRG